eukprot:4817997-Pyramimonas_sp.AAC.1
MYMGRAAGMGARSSKARPTPGRAHMRCAPAEHLHLHHAAPRARHNDFRHQRQRGKGLDEQLHCMKAMDQETLRGRK